MAWKWYNLFSLPEFLATDLISQNLTISLEDVGEKEILITRGNYVSVVYDDVMLPVEFNSENPATRDGFGVFVDVEENVWLGIEVEE